MDTTHAYPLSESGASPDIAKRLADFTEALYRSSVSSPVPLDWDVLPAAIAEIERLRSLLTVPTPSAEALPAVVEGKNAEGIIQVTLNAYAIDALRMADISPPDG